MMPTTLIIGIGNDLRGDDGVGPLAARILQTLLPQTEVLIVQQLTPDLAEKVGTFNTVVFVDADVGAERTEISFVSNENNAVPHDMHQMTPEQLLSVVDAMEEWGPRRALRAAIPARKFEHGNGLSTDAQAGVVECVEAVCNMINEHQTVE